MFCAHVHTYTHRQVFWKVQMLLLDLHSLDSSTLKLKVQPHSLQPVPCRLVVWGWGLCLVDPKSM